jgi:D-alanyl-D-alanine carboxypeptidase/D-alanyl-D-alanine-endopeptidase (penicillin-binding protein 4)
VLVIGALLVPRAAAMPIQPLSSSLDEELHAAGGSDAALVVLDRPGSPALYAHRPTTPRILASNTKLFTTAAGLAHFGSRIASLVRRILLPSDNRLAQDLSNRLGNGSRSRGAAAAVTYAHRLGAHPRLVDGSGLSRSDSASPLDIVHLLTGMEHTRNFSIWVNALPNAGRSGTLQYRMRGTPAAGRCAAKTGTLRDVSALSGYCRTLHGHRVIFSLLFNRVNTHRAEAAEDRMVVRIVRDG